MLLPLPLPLLLLHRKRSYLRLLFGRSMMMMMMWFPRRVSRSVLFSRFYLSLTPAPTLGLSDAGCVCVCYSLFGLLLHSKHTDGWSFYLGKNTTLIQAHTFLKVLFFPISSLVHLFLNIYILFFFSFAVSLSLARVDVLRICYCYCCWYSITVLWPFSSFFSSFPTSLCECCCCFFFKFYRPFLFANFVILPSQK